MPPSSTRTSYLSAFSSLAALSLWAGCHGSPPPAAPLPHPPAAPDAAAVTPAANAPVACAPGETTRTLQVVVTMWSTCALRGDGSVWCWGRDHHGEVSGHPEQVQRRALRTPTRVPGVDHVVQLAAGEEHVCAVTLGGQVRCWGGNSHGQLGLGDRNWNHAPADALGVTHAVEVTAAGLHTCARTREGHVWCWGSNTRGELGHPPEPGSCAMDSREVQPCNPTPQRVEGITHATALSATGALGHEETTCALLADGSARCWGSNHLGALGARTEGASSATPVAVDGVANSDRLSPHGAGAGVCARRRDGSWWCWGQRGEGSAETDPWGATRVEALQGARAVVPLVGARCALNSAGDVSCEPGLRWGRLGPGLSAGAAERWRVQGLTGMDGLVSQGIHGCAWRCAGEVQCWGFNQDGQLGDDSIRRSERPVAVAGLEGVRALSAGPLGVCATGADHETRCWGRVAGRLGPSGAPRGFVPQSAPGALLGVEHPAEVVLGSAHGCARTREGGVVCWGDNEHNQLGTGPGPARDEPAPVPGLSGVTALSAGEHHTCARLADGTLRCWGHNDRGQLGDGTRRARPGLVTPVGVGPARAVVVAYEHSCAVRNDGGVWCWGRDLIPTGGEGENDTDSPRPRALRNLAGVAELAVGHYFAVARMSDGAVRLVRGGGADTRGSDRSLTDVTHVAAGERGACVVAGDAVRCWEQDDGDAAPTIATVEGRPGAAQLVLGRAFACARSPQGRVSCWGDNTDGALGVPRVGDDAPEPVAVRWP